jgi:DNA-binding response OmpR family regulator
MDYIMPNLEGPPATDQIRKLGYNGLVIGLTGQVQPEEQQLFKNSGANIILAKPVHIAKLEDVIRTHVLLEDDTHQTKKVKATSGLEDDDDDEERERERQDVPISSPNRKQNKHNRTIQPVQLTSGDER